MSKKHFFSTPDGMVPGMLTSLASRNPSFGLDLPHRVLFSLTHPPQKVSIISGGGSGHEPAWTGFVGEGMLSAAVCGEIFASPATKQIMAAMKNVPSDEGVILCITNYTGDMLHFGLAREKGEALGLKVGLVVMAEDASLGRKKSGGVGRRGLAGNLLVIKLIGAASELGWSFEQCVKLGNLGNSQLVTIGTSLDHCHVPGRAAFDQVADDACVLGMGIHNEPGLRTISPMPSTEDIVKEMLKYLLDPNDADRAFVEFRSDDEVVLLMNNFGGLSGLEFEALTSVTLTALKRDYNITPSRIYAGILETSLNGLGFSITLGNMSGMARSMDLPTAQIIELLDAPTTAPAWPKNGYEPRTVSKEMEERRQQAKARDQEEGKGDQGPETPAFLIPALTTACNAALAAEPLITKYDMAMGDGDCGEGFSLLCNSILTKLHQYRPSTSTPSPPLLHLLTQIADSVEDAGGSLGAILSILATAFANALHDLLFQTPSSNPELSPLLIATAASRALTILQSYTAARIGDRTVMDVLIPFIDTLNESKDFAAAVEVAQRKAQETSTMVPRFGRATYVGDVAERESFPDPGAFAVGVWLGGLLDGVGL